MKNDTKNKVLNKNNKEKSNFTKVKKNETKTGDME